MTHEPQYCTNIPVAESPLGTVSLCPTCGVMHLSLQYMSMRFELEAFRVLAQMMGAAQCRVDGMLLPVRPAANESHDLPGVESPSGKKIH